MDFRTRQEEERIKLQQQLAQQQLKKQMQSADFSRSDSAYDSFSGSISELKARDSQDYWSMVRSKNRQGPVDARTDRFWSVNPCSKLYHQIRLLVFNQLMKLLMRFFQQNQMLLNSMAVSKTNLEPPIMGLSLS